MTRIPYAGTAVPPEKTQAEIQRLLYDHGAKGVQWTSVGDKVQLKFILEEEGSPYTISVTPAMLKSERRERGRYGRVLTMVDAAASMRLVKWWLKSKLEAVQYGLVTAREEFLANIAGRLPSGEDVTVGQIIIPKLNAMPPSDLARALPSGDPDG